MTARLLAALALCGLLALPAVATEWAVRRAPAEDSGLRAATITNADGNRLYLWPRHGPGIYQIFAEVHLDREPGFGGAMPSYRIDAGETVDTDRIRQAGEAASALWGHAGGRVAFWRVWSSDEAEIRPDHAFNAWLTGETLHLTYGAADGDRITTEFPLAGLRAAITEAAGVKAP